MERLFFRSTSAEHLQAELRRHELLREAQHSHMVRPAQRDRRARRWWDLGDGLRLLVRRLAG
jgi:hypothetical protein